MRLRSPLALAMALSASLSACRDDSPTGPAGNPTDGRVFIDNFVSADYQAFAGSKLDAVSIDNTVKFRGTSSLKFTVPAPGAGYSGGAFVASVARNLTGYNAITFYARASAAATLNVAGLGNDNTGTSLYTVERVNIPLTTTWTKVIIPIPDASKLTAEKGLFYIAEGPEGTASYDIWLDDIQFENLTTITNPRAALTASTPALVVGSTQQIGNLAVTMAVAGADVTVAAMPSYFTFTSSNTSVATVNASGLITVVAGGSTNITAALGTVAATGTIAVTAVAGPASAAPTPTYPSADVISLFSNAYTNRTVNTWSASWDDADVGDVTIAGNAAKRYSNLTFAGIEFTGANSVNATTMTHFRMDIWTPDAAAAPSAFKVKLVDWGADNAFGGGDDREHELTFTATSTPALASGSWITLDIPLSQFTGMTTRGNVSQMIIVGDGAINTVFVDNVLFHK